MKKILLVLVLNILPFGKAWLGCSAADKIVLTGSVQSDMMLAPQADEAIGATESSYDNKYFLTNTYADLRLQSKWVDAGGRFELTQWPMPGFQDAFNDFKGWGVPNLWVKGKFNKVDVTLGSFYEQFGSGFILRSYEERTLGIDNSLNGAKVVTTVVPGLQLKALSGIQRTYWKWEKNLISGADAEFNLDEVIKRMQDSGTRLMIGASWVNKYENTDEEITKYFITKDAEGATDCKFYALNLPKFVNAFDFRAKFQKSGFAALAEYALKTADPSRMNNYIYGKGHAEMLSLTYAKTGISALLQAKRSENMGFRSSRYYSPLMTAGYVNHLPAFTVDQTYSLAALYPYATQTIGEWAYQGSFAYKFKGRYAPKFKVNYSLVTGLENSWDNVKPSANKNELRGTDGAKSAFFKNGEVYYQDLDIMYEQKYNKSWELHLMYMYQQYNMEVMRSHGGNLYAHIGVADLKWKINKQFTLRGEAQYLYTDHESGDWGFGLLELSCAPHFMFTVSDQIGRCEPSSGEYGNVTHYYQVMATGNFGNHRIQLGYGRTRAGYNCNGGVCRYIPASKGFTISYNYNF